MGKQSRRNRKQAKNQANHQDSAESRQTRTDAELRAIITSTDPLDQELVRLIKQHATYRNKADGLQEEAQAYLSEVVPVDRYKYAKHYCIIRAWQLYNLLVHNLRGLMNHNRYVKNGNVPADITLATLDASALKHLGNFYIYLHNKNRSKALQLFKEYQQSRSEAMDHMMFGDTGKDLKMDFGDDNGGLISGDTEEALRKFSEWVTEEKKEIEKLWRILFREEMPVIQLE